jgi:hypothetical protein
VSKQQRRRSLLFVRAKEAANRERRREKSGVLEFEPAWRDSHFAVERVRLAGDSREHASNPGQGKEPKQRADIRPACFQAAQPTNPISKKKSVVDG